MVSWTRMLALEVEEEVKLVGLGDGLDVREEGKESGTVSITGFSTV